MIALSPFAAAGHASTVKYTHSSTLRTVEDVFGLPALRDAANATNLADLFTSQNPSSSSSSGGSSSSGSSGGHTSSSSSGGHTSSSSSGGGGGQCMALNGRADRNCTPGAFNPAVTQATIHSTICVSGWTSTIRPPSSYTSGLKTQQKPGYGESAIADSDLEEDHLVPLELGGNPKDPTNLWPEPRQRISPAGQGAETKDGEETSLKQQVCSGQITLDAARQKILADWTH